MLHCTVFTRSVFGSRNGDRNALNSSSTWRRFIRS